MEDRLNITERKFSFQWGEENKVREGEDIWCWLGIPFVLSVL